jgi:cytosine deaminase
MKGPLMTGFMIARETRASDEVLNVVAHLPTASLKSTVDAQFFAGLADRDFMRIAVLLAQKGYDEGGCPIGAVIVEDGTRQILGKGHNTLVQENHPYNHGETSAIRDAGRRDFSRATMFTSLSPCTICASLVYMRGFRRLVIGNSPGGWNNDAMMHDNGVVVEMCVDQMGVDLYEKFRREKPEQDLEDRLGLAGVHRQYSEHVHS